MLAVDHCWNKVKRANKSKNRRDCRREWNMHHDQAIKLQNVGVDDGDGRETSALSAKPYEYIYWCSPNVVSVTSARGCRHILARQILRMNTKSSTSSSIHLTVLIKM